VKTGATLPLGTRNGGSAGGYRSILGRSLAK